MGQAFQEIWEALPVKERSELAKSKGLEGKLGSRSWSKLTQDEKDILMGFKKAEPIIYQPPTKASPKTVPDSISWEDYKKQINYPDQDANSEEE